MYTQHEDAYIIDKLGGPSAVAKLFDDLITPQAVSQWKTDGIPKVRLQILRMLRPDVDWGYLRGTVQQHKEAA